MFDSEVVDLQDVFDLPFHMARDQIEESLRNKMSSIKVDWFSLHIFISPFLLITKLDFLLYLFFCCQFKRSAWFNYKMHRKGQR